MVHMGRHGSWIVRWAGAAALLAAAVGLFNFVVDPYGLYRWFDSAGVNQQKEGVRNKVRHVKALELALIKPRTLLMGSSRAHEALDPAQPLLQEYTPVYNLGISMVRIREERLYLEHALLHADVRRVILGLDFFMFNARQRVNFTFDPSLVGRRIRFDDYLRTTLLSSSALSDSIATLTTSHRTPARREFLANGFRPADQAFFGLTDYSKAQYYVNWTFLSSLPNSTKYYADMSLDEEVFAEFERVLTLCNERHIDCRFYISPAHMALDGEGVRAAGLWQAMEDWKRRITRLTSDHGVPLWDFSGYNSVTTEPVETPMKYYWDSSHFTVGVGNWIIARAMGASAAEYNIPDDFGVLLTPENIDAHLQSVRADRERYASAHPDEIAERLHSYAEYLHGEPFDDNAVAGLFAQ